ncbi:type II secretory pathway component [Agaribacter marinus]|uniref:MSHA biogenesis protein MshP n=1 Tax=Agaribacter marinus TaxID=1431249 RepID=A0AA37WLA2_9ALTE|nr:type II secretory pathway component [Agaribacter marinus]GLR72244.1 hypothetical protein GCM10007852_31520 [Agaribacter marinus]
MCHSQRQKGSMIVIAIFIMVVLTVLASTMISVISNSSSSALKEVYGLRAQQSAKAGLQTLVSQSFPIGNPVQVCNTNVTSPASFSQIEGFLACRFEARCTTDVISFGGITYNYYKYSSTGQCDLADSTISRTLSVDAMEAL